jgi:hypothetical protein
MVWIGLRFLSRAMEHATCNMQHATCNMQHATCNMQLAMSNMQHDAHGEETFVRDKFHFPAVSSETICYLQWMYNFFAVHSSKENAVSWRFSYAEWFLPFLMSSAVVNSHLLRYNSWSFYGNEAIGCCNPLYRQTAEGIIFRLNSLFLNPFSRCDSASSVADFQNISCSRFFNNRIIESSELVMFTRSAC